MSAYWQGYHRAAWIGSGIWGLLAAVALVQGQWQAALTLAGFLAVTAAYLALRSERLPAVFDPLLVLGLFSCAGGFAWDLYDQVWWYDEAAHAVTPLALTLVFGFYGYDPLLHVLRRHPRHFALTFFSLGMMLGALWEIGEWLAYRYTLAGELQGLADTAIDLIMDGTGAALAIPVAFWASREKPEDSTARYT